MTVTDRCGRNTLLGVFSHVGHRSTWHFVRCLAVYAVHVASYGRKYRAVGSHGVCANTILVIFLEVFCSYRSAGRRVAYLADVELC